ncbi:1362_t:CDS:1, partial [Gigaspora margarita]
YIQDKRTQIEDAPEDKNKNLIEPILEKVYKETKSRRILKK